MNTVPKISIVVPNYNQGKFLEETILSIIEQQYPNLQLIVIDGGSTDHSIQIIKKYEKFIDHWVSEQDNGQSHAINKGLRVASGQLHSFLNSDDLLLPGALFAVAEKYQQNKKQIITAPWLEGIDKANTITRQVIKPLTIESLILNIGLFGQPGTFWTSTTMPTLLNEAYHFCLDFEFFYRLLMSNYTVTVAEKPLAFFRQHARAKTATLQLIKHQEIVYFFERHIIHHPHISTQMLKVLQRNKRTLYRLELLDTFKNHPNKLLHKIWEAIKYDPRILIKGI